ncbi:hypothetical protein Tco_0147905, partial [Tanacetum coccineum]
MERAATTASSLEAD